MKNNTGKTDRILRIILGLVVAITGIVLSSWWGLIGIVFLFTGIFGFCPIYSLLNIHTGKS